MSPTEREAYRRVQRALKSIERAQMELYEACSDLSSVLGLVKDWERLGKVADRVKAEWHRLNEKPGPFKLDGIAGELFLRRQGAAAAAEETP